MINVNAESNQKSIRVEINTLAKKVFHLYKFENTGRGMEMKLNLEHILEIERIQPEALFAAIVRKYDVCEKYNLIYKKYKNCILCLQKSERSKVDFELVNFGEMLVDETLTK